MTANDIMLCKVCRRDFLKTAAAAGAAASFPAIVPASALGKDGAVAPNERVNSVVKPWPEDMDRWTLPLIVRTIAVNRWDARPSAFRSSAPTARDVA